MQARRKVLRQYLQNEKPSDPEDETAVYLYDLFQAWDYAVQADNEQLQTAAMAVIALLLKALSSDIDLSSYGMLLCKSVLQDVSTKRLRFALSAEAQKGHLISPALRLITEVVTFDGGAFARRVYAKRDDILEVRAMERNLNLVKHEAQDVSEEKRRPSLRTNAVRYLLANLKFQSGIAKSDMIKQRYMRVLFDRISEDPVYVAQEILQTLTQDVLLDASISRSSKVSLLHERRLSAIAQLYRLKFSEVEESPTRIDRVAYEFLRFVCTSREAGAIVHSTGWYPPGDDKDKEMEDEHEEEDDEDDNDLVAERSSTLRKYRDRVPVRNPALADFAGDLRPYANMDDQKLLLSLFQAVPELVADYFHKKTNFSYDPKLTSTWIGYSSFLFSTIKLPVPKFFGRHDGYAAIPPPPLVVIESILPKPLDQQTLSRCLSQRSELVTFFAIRILVVAMEKLKSVIDEFRKASRSAAWTDAEDLLVAEFCTRCPKMSDVIAVFRKPLAKVQREAVTRLISLYYSVVPQLALDEKFDISVPLADALLQLDQPASDDADPGDRPLQVMDLEHLTAIASCCTSMQWFKKTETSAFIPFVSVLKSGISSATAALLLPVVKEQQSLRVHGSPNALDALMSSLHLADGTPMQAPVWAFLDNCLSRYAQRPIKYQDDFKTLVAGASSDSEAKAPLISFLLMTILEQWPFVDKNSTNNEAGGIAHWIATFVAALKNVGEDGMELQLFQKAMVKATTTGFLRQQVLRTAFEEHADQISTEHINALREVRALANDVTAVSGRIDTIDSATLQELEHLPQEDQKHPGLTRWAQRDVQEAVDDGRIGELAYCLCSEHLSIRKQALGQLRQLVSKVDASTYEEREQLSLLLCELGETARPVIDERPLPYIAGAVASHAILILADPTHLMYPKVNRLLNKAPSWNVDRLPSYFVDKVLFGTPDEDNGHYEEVEWLLDVLVDGLRTMEDMDLYRSRSIFERFLALYNTTFSTQAVRYKIVKLMYRAVAVGGTTTLMTRAGFLSWLQAHGKGNGLLKQLAIKLWQGCDQEKVRDWGGGFVEKVITNMEAVT